LTKEAKLEQRQCALKSGRGDCSPLVGQNRKPSWGSQPVN